MAWLIATGWVRSQRPNPSSRRTRAEAIYQRALALPTPHDRADVLERLGELYSDQGYDEQANLQESGRRLALQQPTVGTSAHHAEFGEDRGATLFQVAQTDPGYLRSLALTAQRPQVRAAAIQLVLALEASQRPPGRRRTPKDRLATL